MMYDNGVYREETPDEISQREAESKIAESLERHRPLSDQELMNLMIRQNVQTLSVDDATAVRMRSYYPEWSGLIGQKAVAGRKFVHEGELYEVNQPGGHDFSEAWVPGKGTESLYRLIPEYFAGDQYDPIPWKGNMILELNKYYVEEGVIYHCWNGSGQAVFGPLSALQAFVKVVE